MSTRTHTSSTGTSDDKPPTSLAIRIAIAWTFVGVPLVYGIYETSKKAAVLFTG